MDTERAPEDMSGSLHNNLNTTDLTGEYEDRNFVVTRGDSRIAMTIAKNDMTVKFTRKNRFLIDDPDAPFKLAYLLTKPLMLGTSYNGMGVYKFVLQEVNATDDDDQERGIADFYKHFPKPTQGENNDDQWLLQAGADTHGAESDDGQVIDTDNVSPDTGKKVWL